MGQRRVVIWSTKEDTTADRVQRSLARLGVSPIRVDVDEYGRQVKFQWELTESPCLISASECIPICDIGAIYYRRPHVTEVPCDVRDFGIHESWYFGRSLLHDAIAAWLNHPAAVDAAEDKLLQLKRASSAGLRVPDSILTSSPEQARRFCEGRQVVCKPGFGGVISNKASTRVIYTWRVPDLCRVQDFDSVELCPTFLQVEIKKVCDVRVTVVGDRLSAVRILSPQGILDWREHIYSGALAYDTIVVDSGVRSGILQLMASLGIEFGALDFAIDTNGSWWFLEVNPAGQWEWLEEFAGTNIAADIATWLTERSGA